MNTETQPFSSVINAAIDEAGLAKEPIANAAGMHLATLYRVLNGGPVSKPKAYAIIRAVNRLAMFQAVDEAAALRSAGYEPDHSAPEPDNVLVASLIDHFVYLPEMVQSDILEQVKALYKKYAE